MKQKKSVAMDLVPVERIENKILSIRGKKVMLDRDLSLLYGVKTKVLNQAVGRNKERFPEDFMFQLTKEELENWRSQIVTSNRKKMGIRRKPYAFTEQGVAMLSSALRSKKAIQVNIAIMRVFVRLKEIISTHKELAHRLVELERRMENKDEEIQAIFQVIRKLMAPLPENKRRIIGFRTHND